MGGSEKKYVQEAFDSNWIAPIGPNIQGFEHDLENFLGQQVSVATLSSGTAAIHLALILSGVKYGDEVLCSSFTFSGSCNPIVYLGAIPVFVDSEKDTWNMDPVLLEEAIEDRIKRTGKRPKALVLVDLYGMPAKLDLLIEIARKYEIPVIEDAAEALGSRIGDRFCGTYGDFGILSFNGNKIITTSGGGALVSKSEKMIEKARFLATQARDSAPHYEHSEIGYNYRLSNVCAGIGRGQMEVIKNRVSKKRSIFQAYFDRLDPQAVEFLAEPTGFFSNRWLTTILIKKDGIFPEMVRSELEKRNIETRPLWKPMHLQPVFSRYPSFTSGLSEALFAKGLCLPSGTSMNEAELDLVIGELVRLGL